MDERPVEIPITDSLDLHPFRPGEVRDVVREYLEQARLRRVLPILFIRQSQHLRVPFH